MKIKKMFYLMLLFMVLGAARMNAQVRIGGTSGPDESAVLDLNGDEGSNVKGLLLPRVALGSTSTVPAGMGSPANGLILFNIATVEDVTPGVYYYDGPNAKWVRIGVAGVNTVINAAAGLNISGSGTTVDPYILGIADNGVATAKINANAVTTAKIGDSQVTSAKIADGGVALVDLATGSVNSAKIVDASIVAADIANGAVNADKLAANAVTSAKITDLTIVNADIANATINAAKLAQSGATTGQFLRWNGSAWAPNGAPGSVLVETHNFSNTFSSDYPVGTLMYIQIDNISAGTICTASAGLYGSYAGSDGWAVYFHLFRAATKGNAYTVRCFK
jgi:hypothetical protein